MNKLFMCISLGLAILSGCEWFAIHSLKLELEVSQSESEQYKQKRDELAVDLESSEEEQRSLIADLKHYEKIITERDTDLTHSRHNLAVLSEKLRGLRKTDEKYKSWSGAPVPDSVIRLLRRTRTSDNSKN